MYEAHFGLKTRPFGTKAEGSGVFVGPAQTQAISSLHKGLAAQDAVVTVTGPVGVGKTTIVNRALDSITPNRMAAWVGRMQMEPDEILDLLLAGFGVRQQVKGTIRRFAAFRKLLAERAAAGTRVAIVVEDAQRLGVDALVEIETLTAADTGDGNSANVILMGQPGLNTLLASPDLARLKQRSRLRQKLEPLSPAEVRGYLKHCIREAGGDFDAIFGAAAIDVIHGCSEGVPRMINTLCENALTAAMEEGLKQVSAALMYRVACESFDYDGRMPDVTEAAPPESMAEPVASGETLTAAMAKADTADEADVSREAPAKPAAPATAMDDFNEADLPPSARNIVVESGRYPELPEIPADSPLNARDETAGVPESRSEPESSLEIDDIPEFINDTQPELTRIQPPGETGLTAPLRDDTAETADVEKQVETGQATDAAPAKPAQANAEDDENFDIDAALTIDVEETNVMKGITPNLDTVAGRGKERVDPANESAAEPPDNLPTLSDSMRIDVDVEVKKARQTTTAAPSAGNAGNAGNAGKVPGPAPSPKAAASATPAAAAKAAATAAAESARNPATASKPQPSANREASPKPAAPPVANTPTKGAEPPKVLAGEPGKAAQAEATAKPVPEAGKNTPEPGDVPPALEPDLELVAASEALSDSESADDAAKAKPAAAVSEMTARIAAIDPARRKNDVDSLEAALDAAKKGELEELLGPSNTPPVNLATPTVDEPREAVPEITLDDVLTKQQAQTRELEKFAEEIGKANSLEEFSDAMAETLFGNEEFNQIAAAVVANPPTEDQALESQNVEDEIAQPPPDGPSPVQLEPEQAIATAAAANDPERVTVEEPGGLKDSQALRMDMLNAMKQKAGNRPGEEIEVHGEAPAAPSPKPSGPQPEPIENQINTSMTQTLEALNVSQAADSVAEAKEDSKTKKSGGLFSRFRKSS
jgi:general secretion pathway protein A